MFDQICHLPILEEVSLEDILCFEACSRHQFLIEGIILNQIAAEMASRVDEHIGEPSRCEQYYRVGLLLIEGRHNDQRPYPYTGFPMTESLLHKVTNAMFLNILQMRQLRVFDGGVDKFT